MIPRFTKGTDSYGLKLLNMLVDAVNGLLNLRGDGKYTQIVHDESGPIITINTDQILSLVPKDPARQFDAIITTAATASGFANIVKLGYWDMTSGASTGGVFTLLSNQTYSAFSEPVTLVHTGDILPAKFRGINGSYPTFTLTSPLSTDCRIAYLTQVGGSNGSTTSYCTYTYNAYFDAAKTQLAGGTLTVQAHRMLEVPVTAATLGIIQKDSTNNYALMSVLDEYPATNVCT